MGELLTGLWVGIALVLLILLAFSATAILSPTGNTVAGLWIFVPCSIGCGCFLCRENPIYLADSPWRALGEGLSLFSFCFAISHLENAGFTAWLFPPNRDDRRGFDNDDDETVTPGPPRPSCSRRPRRPSPRPSPEPVTC